MEFKVARLDKIAKGISAFVLVLLGVLSTVFLIKVPSPHNLVFILVFVLIVVISYLWSPRRYLIEGSKLVIEKIAGHTIVVPLEEVEGCVTIPDLGKLKVSRTLGNGGLFGFYGLFSTAEYGDINCQLTSLKNLVIIKTKRGSFALSPFDLTEFENHLRNVVTGITGRLETLTPAPAGAVRRARPLVLLVPTAVFVVTIALVASFMAQLPERIAVHFNFTGDPDRWATASGFLTASLIPAVFLFVINIIIFLTVRQTTARHTIPNFLVIFMSLIQCLVGYVTFDLFWFNTRGRHPVPMVAVMIGFGALVVALLAGYYLMLKKRS